MRRTINLDFSTIPNEKLVGYNKNIQVSHFLKYDVFFYLWLKKNL